MPEEPLGPEELLSAPPSSSLGLSKILPAEVEDADRAFQGMCTLIWLLIPRKAKHTEEHAPLVQNKKEKRAYLGKEYGLLQMNQLPWMKPDTFWSSVRNIGFYKIHEMNALGHTNIEI